MDPNATMAEIVRAFNAGEGDEWESAINDYDSWLLNGGFSADDETPFLAISWAVGTQSEHLSLQTWKKGKMWFYRLSAVGYLDCTDNYGPYDSELDAVIEAFNQWSD